MSYKDKPQIKLYKYENSAFVLQAIIDDFEEVSFEHNLYEAGTFTITINYNIPNALLFQRGLFCQFGNNPYDFGEIYSIQDSIGEDGKGSQIRTITGYDARYILKRRVIKNMNSNGLWAMTDKGEIVLRNLIKDQCGSSAESKRQLPIANVIPSSSSAKGKEYSASENFSNLYEVCKTIATQSEIGWRIAFDGALTLEVFEGQDLSQTVRFDTSYESLANGNFQDSSDAFSNAIYIGGKGQNDDRDIYEGEDGSPTGLDRFESWDNQSSLTVEAEYEAEAVSMLTQYGQTLTMSGNGLAKCPYIFREQYDIGDSVTVAFSGKSAKAQILSITEHWAWGSYDIEFAFGKPQNNLADQLQLMLRKIQEASNKTNSTDSVRWYTIPTDTAMPKADVTYNTIGFIGTCASGGSTFQLYLDNEKTGAKTYHIYFKQLGGGKLTLTTGVSGASSLTLNSGTYVAIIYVDENGNVTSQGATATTTIEAGNTQPATSSAVNDALPFKYERIIPSANTSSTNPNRYIRISNIATNNTSSTDAITFLIGTRYNRYLLVINPWYTSAEKLQLITLSENNSIASIVDVAFSMSSTSQAGTMEVLIKLRCNQSATKFVLTDISRVISQSYVCEDLGNDSATYSGTTVSAYFDTLTKGSKRFLEFATPSFNIPRGGTFTTEFIYKQQINEHFAMYMGRATLGADASGGSLYIQLDGLDYRNGDKVIGSWGFKGIDLSGSFEITSNTSIWLSKGYSSTRPTSTEGAGQVLEFTIFAYKA